MIKPARQLSVAPLVRLPQRLGVFDYLDLPEKETQRGQIVWIHLRAQKVLGVVLGPSYTKFPKRVKLLQIDKVLSPAPVFLPQHLELALWLANYYFTGLGVVLNSMLPCQTQKFLSLFTALPFALSPAKTQKNIPTLLFYPAYTERFDYYNELINSKLKNTSGQILIVVPTLQSLTKWTTQLKNLDFTVYASSLQGTKLQKTYSDIASGKARIIIGTRFAIFAPFANLQTIIVDDENNPFHKQEEPNPRFHVRQVCEKMQELWAAELYFGTDSPSMEAWQKVQSQKWNLQYLNPLFTTQNTKTKTLEQSAMEIASFQGGWPITGNLKIAIDEALFKKEKVFLFVNRLGTARLAACRDCGLELKCEICNIPLQIRGENKQMFCTSCNKLFEPALCCKNCGGIDLKLQGMGIEAIEVEVKNIWPACKIARVDSTVTRQDFSSAQIIIGTVFALPDLPYDQIGLIAVASLEQLLAGTDFRAQERTFATLSRFKQYPAKLIIQTFNIDHPFLKILQNGYEAFAQNELEERKIFHWPPFAIVAQIIAQDADKSEVEKRIKKVCAMLRKKQPDLDISSPAPLYPAFVRGRYRYGANIKLPADFNPRENDLFSKLPPNCIIDIDPLRIN